MTQEHPITPPPELVEKWVAMLEYCEDLDVFTDVAQWGADQELEGCVKLLSDLGGDGEMIRRVRRPKPPSLKEQALTELERWAEDKYGLHKGLEVGIIRRALESLPD